MKTAQKEARNTKEQRLLDGGWRILASANDTIFVVESPYLGVQALHFYFDASNNASMVEGYFTSSFGFKARNELLNDPQRFVEEFYLHCGGIDADWCTKEEYL